ncbi:MAG: signal peptidase I [Candidatus Marinimicrobia bacterium]|nr:signal peptidase I [Candidatus Neomarinimicrobiota bacterium]
MNDSSKSKAGRLPENRESHFMREVKSFAIIILIALGLRATVVEAYIVPTGSMEKTIMVGDFLIGNKFIFGMRTPDRLGIPYTTIGVDIPWFRLPAFRQPHSGDVIIFKYPHNPLDKYVKRLIAGPGQVVQINQREITVDGEPFFHPKHLQFVDRKPKPEGWINPNIFPRGNGNKDYYNKVRVPARGDTLSADEDLAILWYVAIMDGHSLDLRDDRMIMDGDPIDSYIVEQDYYFMMGDNRDQSSDSRFWGFVPHRYILGEALFVYFSLDLKHFPFLTWQRLGRIGNTIE